MPRDLSGKTADTERFNSTYRIAFLVEVDADEPGVGAVTQYSGSRKYAVGAVTYLDDLAQNGIELPWRRLNEHGGIAPTARTRITKANEEKASDLLQTYFLDNDEFRVYVMFVTGAETASDKVLLQKCVIEDYPFDIRRFQLMGIDRADQEFFDIPTEIIEPTEYPYAASEVYGLPIPVTFGYFAGVPNSLSQYRAALAPTALVDVFARKYHGGKYLRTSSALYQYYAHTKRYGTVVNYTPSLNGSTIDTLVRATYLWPGLPTANNQDSTWFDAASGEDAAYTEVLSETLEVQFSGSPKVGTITSSPDPFAYVRIKIEFIPQANGLVTVVENGVTHSVLDNYSWGAAGGTINEKLEGDYSADWNFETITVKIVGSNPGCLVRHIYLVVYYEDQQSADFQQLDIGQRSDGWNDKAAYYNDGAVVSSDNAALINPIHQLEALLRGKPLLNKPESEIDLTSFDNMATYRSGWAFSFALNTQVNMEFISDFCQEAGLHLFMNADGKWAVTAEAKDRTPDHYFGWNSNMAVVNPGSDVSDWVPDCKFSRTPSRDLINEIVVRYRKDYPSGEFTATRARGPHYRVTGTDGILTPTTGVYATLDSATATFQTDGVAVNDRGYMVGYIDLIVSSINSETQLTVYPADGSTPIARSSSTFWVGPYTDGQCIRSWRRYKTINPLGEKVTLRNGGGHESNFIGSVDDLYPNFGGPDTATADAFIQHIKDWRCERLLKVEFATFLNGIDVELGDILFLDHPWLPPVKRRYIIGTISAGVNASATAWTSGEADLLEVGDYLLADNEIVRVSAVPYDGANFTVVRGECNTVGAAHANGSSMRRFNHIRWFVTGVKIDVQKAQVRVEAIECPTDYKIRGKAVAIGADDYDVADWEERLVGGFASQFNALMRETDAYSAITHVQGDTGTYSIT